MALLPPLVRIFLIFYVTSSTETVYPRHVGQSSTRARLDGSRAILECRAVLFRWKTLRSTILSVVEQFDEWHLNCIAFPTPEVSP